MKSAFCKGRSSSNKRSTNNSSGSDCVEEFHLIYVIFGTLAPSVQHCNTSRKWHPPTDYLVRPILGVRIRHLVRSSLPSAKPASSLSCSSMIRNGSSQSSSNASTTCSPRSCTPPKSQHLKASGSLARSAATSSPIWNRTMHVHVSRAWVKHDCFECSPLVRLRTMPNKNRSNHEPTQKSGGEG